MIKMNNDPEYLRILMELEDGNVTAGSMFINDKDIAKIEEEDRSVLMSISESEAEMIEEHEEHDYFHWLRSASSWILIVFLFVMSGLGIATAIYGLFL